MGPVAMGPVAMGPVAMGPVMMAPELALMYLSSPALPIGAFHWSRGLEQAALSGAVKDLSDLADYLTLALNRGLGRFDLPLLALAFKAACFRDYGTLSQLNDLSLAARESSEFGLEEVEGGKAVKRLAWSLGLWPEKLDPGFTPGLLVGQALLAVFLGLGPNDLAWVLNAFAFAWLQNQISAAARTLKLGQSDLQALILALCELIPGVSQRAMTLPVEDLGPGLTGLAMFSAHHESQTGRLFRS
jgi:urease accessory protein